MAEKALRFDSGCCFALWQLFFDTCRLAAAVTQVVQLGAANITTTLDFDASDHRAVGLERTFHAFATGDLAHGEAAVQTTVTLGDHNTFVGLDTLARTFHHVDVDDHGVAGGKFRNGFTQTGNFFLLKSLNQIHFELFHLSILHNATLKAAFAQQFGFIDDSKKLILVTGHRRESFGGGFEQICAALSEIAKTYPDCDIVYPVHLNPNVKEPVYRLLSDVSNVHLIPPQDYLPFVYLMNRSYLVLTDSGGIQEEAPSLGKPVLVMRDTTERPEAVAAGTVKLVGTTITDGASGYITADKLALLSGTVTLDHTSNSINTTVRNVFMAPPPASPWSGAAACRRCAARATAAAPARMGPEQSQRSGAVRRRSGRLCGTCLVAAGVVRQT